VSATRKEKPSSHLSVQKALSQKILGAFQRLPANQQKVANYILQQPNELAFVTTDLLARRLKVSKPTIVRFARSLGYEGFTDLQRECLGALQSDLSNMNAYMGELKKLARDETLARVVESEMQNINETLDHFDRAVFMEIVNLILRAEKVFTMGIGVSSLLSQLLAYELNQVAVDARSISNGPTRLVELLEFSKKGDVVVGFSFPPYSRETVEAAAFARQRGADVIAMTETRTSPITFHASQVLVVRTTNMLYTNSIAAMSIMMNALVTEIALKNKKAIAPRMESISRVMSETGQYIR
jgi:DNA-binding MurR/RpiR family transcriptional regulator